MDTLCIRERDCVCYVPNRGGREGKTNKHGVKERSREAEKNTKPDQLIDKVQ